MMSYQHDRDVDDPHSPGSTTRAAPGKRGLTDRLQRKAIGVAPLESAAPPPRYVDPTLSSDVSFVDQLLATPVQRRATGAPAADVHDLAAAGTAGAGGALPFAEGEP